MRFALRVRFFQKVASDHPSNVYCFAMIVTRYVISEFAFVYNSLHLFLIDTPVGSRHRIYCHNVCMLNINQSGKDPYRGCGTSYLHTMTRNNDLSSNPVSVDSTSDRNSNPSGAIVVPISLATTFQQSVPGVPVNVDDPNSFGKGYEYSRTGNPTRGAFERAIALAEHAQYAVAFASGSAATSAVIHSTVQHNDHIICVDDVYGGTQRYFRQIVTPVMGMKVDFCDMSDPSSLPWKTTTTMTSTTGDNTIQNVGDTKLVWLETPTNPTLKITDIHAMADEIRRNHPHCTLAVDNTFCSPYFQTPLNLGADIVVHSVTKYVPMC
jgi:cystathionine beta-lyase/cystathionine gamma-synthase